MAVTSLPDFTNKQSLRNIVLSNYLYHIWELSKEVLYDLVPKGVLKCDKLKLNKVICFNFDLLYFWYPLNYRVISNKYLRVDFGLSVTVERLNDLGNRLY